MISGIDPRHRSNGAEFSDGGVGDLRVIDDIGGVAHDDVEQNGAGADLAIFSEACELHFRTRIDQRLDRKHLAGHLRIPKWCRRKCRDIRHPWPS
jgi:hypothetical protein